MNNPLLTLLLLPLLVGACGQHAESADMPGAAAPAVSAAEPPVRPAPPLPRQARITVTFAAAPVAATARIAPLLYNKTRVLHFEEDDSPRAVFTEAYPLFQGGKSPTGQVFPGLRFTDGCGHPRPYTGAVAINGHNPSYNNTEWLSDGMGHDAGKLVWAQVQTLLNHGWDVENHSDLHTPDNPARQLADLDVLIAKHLNGYQPSVFVVPTNFAGYPTAAFEAGYLAVTSASQGDQYPMLNPYNEQRIALSSLPVPPDKFVYRRYNADLAAGETSGALITRLNRLSDDLMAPGEPATEGYLQRVFTHGIDLNVLTTWMNHTQAIARDQLWVTTLREFDEYRRTSHEVKKTETLRGNTLTIGLNYSGVHPRTRFPSLTLLLDTPGVIANVSVTGADSISYNKATKMVNVFRH
jgi:hypothetical protein